MPFSTWTLWIIDICLVIVGWILFMLIFLRRSRSRRTPVKERYIRSWYGFGLEVVGYAIMATCLRYAGTSFLMVVVIGETICTLAAAAVIAASIRFTRAAVRALGRQWSLGAQVLEGHELITDGVYGVVRHPIYTGMFSMFFGCALAISSWWAMLVG